MEPECSLPHSQVPANLSLSWPSSIQSILPRPTSMNIHLIILPSTPGTPKWSLSLMFPHQNTVDASPLPHTHYMPRSSHSSRFYHPNNIGWALSSSFFSFLRSLVTSSLLGPNILLITLFSNTPSLRSSFNVSEQVSHPYKTIDKIIILCIFIFKFLDSKLEDKRFCTEW